MFVRPQHEGPCNPLAQGIGSLVIELSSVEILLRNLTTSSTYKGCDADHSFCNLNPAIRCDTEMPDRLNSGLEGKHLSCILCFALVTIFSMA